MSDQFGDRLKAARTVMRTDRGLPKVTLQAIADQFGVSKPSVAAWERGIWPEKERMLPLAKMLGVHPSWLYFGIGSPTGLPNHVGNGTFVPFSVGGVSVPAVTPEAAARDFDAAIAEAKEHVTVHGDFPGRTAIMTISDRSNDPVLMVGDRIVVCADVPAKPGDWCLVRVGPDRRQVVGVLAVSVADGRRVRVVETANGKWPDEVLADSDAVVGKIVQHIRDLA